MPRESNENMANHEHTHAKDKRAEDGLAAHGLSIQHHLVTPVLVGYWSIYGVHGPQKWPHGCTDPKTTS